MATADDVRTQQAFVAAEEINLSVAVEACTQLAASSVDAWHALAAQCLRFVSREPVFGTVTLMADEGASLVSQLGAWRASLTALGCTPPTLKEVPAPPPVGTPNPIFAALGSLGNALPIVLVYLVVREWNEARR